MKIVVRKRILKWAVIAGIVILPLLMFIFPQWFPGILYPIKDFDFHLVNSVGEPPIRDRKPGEEYPEGFTIILRHISSSQFSFKSAENFYGTKPRKKLYIKEIAWEWEEGYGVFTQDFVHEFSETAWSHPENGWHCISWVTVGLVPDEFAFPNIETIRQMEMIKRRIAPGNYFD